MKSKGVRSLFFGMIKPVAWVKQFKWNCVVYISILNNRITALHFSTVGAMVDALGGGVSINIEMYTDENIGIPIMKTEMQSNDLNMHLRMN